MKRHRINLHIREDVSPALYRALAALAPKPRAERLRVIAELGLQLELRRSEAESGERNSAPIAELPALRAEDWSGEGSFRADLEWVIGHAR
jgi:hypothetical protein